MSFLTKKEQPGKVYRKSLYFLLLIAGFAAVFIGICDLIIGIFEKKLSFNSFAGFLWAAGFFILAIIAKKKKKKLIKFNLLNNLLSKK